ncbi:hypothetical protein TNCV_1311611 [Trichonephila clavipes]|nr:hypothetical protein TNCV_1311611 [Trichonephila clavipes]
MGKKWSSLMESSISCDLPRPDGVANFRITTGHDDFTKLLYNLNFVHSQTRPLGNAKDLFEDYLVSCFELGDIAGANAVKKHYSFYCVDKLHWTTSRSLA